MRARPVDAREGRVLSEKLGCDGIVWLREGEACGNGVEAAGSEGVMGEEVGEDWGKWRRRFGKKEVGGQHGWVIALDSGGKCAKAAIDGNPGSREERLDNGVRCCDG